MANRALLYASDETGFPCDGDRLLRGRDYAVPLLWLASADVEAIDHEEDPEEPGEGAWFTCICIEVKRARQLLWRRRAALEAIAHNASELMSSWTTFLEGLEERYLKLEVSEVLYMHATGDDLLVSALAALDDPSDDRWAALIALTDLGVHFDLDARVLRTPPATTSGELMARFGEEPSEGDLAKILPPEAVDVALAGYPIETEPEHFDSDRRSDRSQERARNACRGWPVSLVLTIAAAVLAGAYVLYISGGAPRGLVVGGSILSVGLAMATRSALSLPVYVLGSVVMGAEAVLAGAIPWGGVTLLAGIPGARAMLREARGEE